jgi:hypothetical protein
MEPSVPGLPVLRIVYFKVDEMKIRTKGKLDIYTQWFCYQAPGQITWILLSLGGYFQISTSVKVVVQNIRVLSLIYILDLI